MKKEQLHVIAGLKLVLTCGTCPEQYDVYDGDSPILSSRRVGYLRLMHGEFTAQMPDSEGKTVYYSEPLGDGEFDDSEREIELNLAAWTIRRRMLHA